MPDLATYQRQFVETIDGKRHGDPILGVYRNTSVKGAIDALADNYQTVLMVVGESTFVALAIDFVADCPPDSPVLAAYGAGFADWLEMQGIGRTLPYLSGYRANRPAACRIAPGRRWRRARPTTAYLGIGRAMVGERRGPSSRHAFRLVCRARAVDLARPP